MNAVFVTSVNNNITYVAVQSIKRLEEKLEYLPICFGGVTGSEHCKPLRRIADRPRSLAATRRVHS